MAFWSRKPIERIDRRIVQLDHTAAELFAREHEVIQEVAELQQTLAGPAGRIRGLRASRLLKRRQRELERLISRRRGLVDRQVRSIMFALQEQSQRTRDELDHQLECLAPVQERWERLRSTFDCLEETIRGPAFVSLAEQWQGQLKIPEFPLAQRSGYAKPFPEHALLF